jgi:hypothetical protein
VNSLLSTHIVVLGLDGFNCSPHCMLSEIVHNTCDLRNLETSRQYALCSHSMRRAQTSGMAGFLFRLLQTTNYISGEKDVRAQLLIQKSSRRIRVVGREVPRWANAMT